MPFWAAIATAERGPEGFPCEAPTELKTSQLVFWSGGSNAVLAAAQAIGRRSGGIVATDADFIAGATASARGRDAGYHKVTLAAARYAYIIKDSNVRARRVDRPRVGERA